MTQSPPPVTRVLPTIVLDRPRVLRLDVHAAAEIEERSGKTLPQLLGTTGKLSWLQIRWLTWGMLLHEDPTLTPAAVEQLLQAHWFEQGRPKVELEGLIAKAFNLSWLYGPPEPEPASPDGAASSRSGNG